MSREADVLKRIEVRISRDEVERLVAALADAKGQGVDASNNLAWLRSLADGTTCAPKREGVRQDWDNWSDNDRVTVSWIEES